MDSAEDGDLQLSLSSHEILHELRDSLPRLLFHTSSGTSELSRRRLRRGINTARLDHLLLRLNFFQELPQLLDPVLAELLCPLTLALPQCAQLTEISQEAWADKTATSVAVCKLLYAFCKVRGYKVIVRFFSNEVGHIASLVEALERLCKYEGAARVCWEERYIFLLWLSHLILNPFPLLTVGKGSNGPQSMLEIPWTVPRHLLFVHRICALALFNLSSPSKERDSAVILITRLVLRPDVHEFSLLDQVMSWSIRTLERPSPNQDVYEVIGILSLVSAILKSAKHHLIGGHIVPLYELIQALSDRKNEAISGNSAVVRKLIVKILRYIVISMNHAAQHDTGRSNDIPDDYIIEDAIENLLNNLSDSDSPVRFAASKSISAIAMKLPTEMAEELVDSIIDMVEEDIGSAESNSRELTGIQEGHLQHVRLEFVNPFRWQGLVLTLSHLLLHGAIQPTKLPSVLDCLLPALSFEQRTATGLPLGNIVRDAANFGIWSLARRYSTSELQELNSDDIRYRCAKGRGATLLQIIAYELISAACLDPFGNIRRGASAALQELIGRHPNTILEGIRIVQTVDYHAVALYRRALTVVTLEAAGISTVYRERLLQSLLTWRGIFAVDANARLQAAATYGRLVERQGEHDVAASVSMLWKDLEELPPHDISRRHGLLSTLAELVAASRRNQNTSVAPEVSNRDKAAISVLWEICLGRGGVDDRCLTDFSLRPALTAEAVSHLLYELCEFSRESSLECPHNILQTTAKFIELSVNTSHTTAVERAASAAAAYLKLCRKNGQSLTDTLSRWFGNMNQSIRSGPGRQANLPGWFVVLGSIFSELDPEFCTKAYDLFLLGLSSLVDIETKVAALRSLSSVPLTATPPFQLIAAMKLCLVDYTIDQRGDVGSLVRIAALKCFSIIVKPGASQLPTEKLEIEGLVCGLAVEKLDKVRIAARECLLAVQAGKGKARVDDVHSAAYFSFMLSYASEAHLLKELLSGLSSTVNAASDSVSRSCRSGFEEFLVNAEEDVLLQTLDAFDSLLQSRLDDERIIVSLLETVAFALGTNAFSSLYQSERATPKFRSIFTFTQRSHLKTANLSKIIASIEIYSYLININCVQSASIRKLLNLLLHPFPAVRQSAAENLFCSSQDDALLPVDWALPPKDLKAHVERARIRLLSK